jgi:undecaprenyl diphosphate synthase
VTPEARAPLGPGIDPDRIPAHVAVIMDGNRRWARSHRLPTIEGHRRGVIALREMVRGCVDLGISVLTVYAFSTENWKREALEVSLLLDLLVQFAISEAAELQKAGVRVRAIGRLEQLPRHQQDVVRELESKTAANRGLLLNVAINYSARAELVDAAKAIANAVKAGELDSDAIDEQLIQAHLYTAQLPDPDILIRTGGDYRLSNFLLWQVAYTELWVTDRFWPDFRRQDLVDAVVAFQKRDRRFGGS